jgi:hypothetical protein
MLIGPGLFSRPVGGTDAAPGGGARGGAGARGGGGAAGGRAAGAQTRRPDQANGAVFIGEKGILTTDTYGANVRLLPAARMTEYRLPPQLLTRSPGHHRDWIRACKGGDQACSNFSVAGPFTEWILLGSIALRFEGKLEWDAKRMRFTSNNEANKYLKPEFRKGWKFNAV